MRELFPDFECDEDGNFSPLQCNAVSDGFNCMCVKPLTGDTIADTEIVVADLVDAPDCSALGKSISMNKKTSGVECLVLFFFPAAVFESCTYEYGGATYSVEHGEYYLNVVQCTRCRCDNGEATACDPTSTCMSITASRTGCSYDGQEYEDGEHFEV